MTAASSGVPGLDLVAERGLALEHDQRADPLARELLARAHHLLDDLRLALERSRGKKPRPTRAERAPDVVLEQHDHDQHAVLQEVLEQRAQRDELEDLRGHARREQHEQAEQDLERARAADQQQQPVDPDRDEHDVDHVAHGVEVRAEVLEQLGQHAPERLDHGSCSTRSPYLRAAPRHRAGAHGARDVVDAHRIGAREHRDRARGGGGGVALAGRVSP